VWQFVFVAKLKMIFVRKDNVLQKNNLCSWFLQMKNPAQDF